MPSYTSNIPISILLCCLLFLYWFQSAQKATENSHSSSSSIHQVHRNLDQTQQSQLSLFSTVPSIQVLGPTSFPKPTDIVQPLLFADETSDIAIEPTIGTHRPEQDVVVAFAAEYPLYHYVLFVETLQKTGFAGDIVLVVSKLDMDQEEIREYFSLTPNLVIYSPRIVCYNAEQETVESAKGGMRTCQCHDIYGRRKGETIHTMDDPRGQRTLANIRYELYWVVAMHYNPYSWMLLVDARDTVFQANPFANVPRNTDPSGRSGVLYFFGENVEATRIGKSKQNNKWVRTAYGDIVGDALANKPTICSGASMGEQVAVEVYLRAMVTEADETGTVLMGSDQGFHNRLYYSNKLGNAYQIHAIVVFDQGR